MSPRVVVIAGIGFEGTAKVSFAEHNNMIEAVPADGTDQPLRIRVFARATEARWDDRECPWPATAGARHGHRPRRGLGSADIIGHDKDTMTYGLYSGGASLEVKRNAIEKLRYT
jgi:hypothetical protein